MYHAFHKLRYKKIILQKIFRNEFSNYFHNGIAKSHDFSKWKTAWCKKKLNKNSDNEI